MTAATKKTSLNEALSTVRPFLVSTIFFSLFINILMFIGPLYMLQIYDRVLSSRSESTLVALTVIAGSMLLVYAFLEWTRSRILVRAGIKFDEVISKKVFSAAVDITTVNPRSGGGQALRDMDSIREFLTGTGLIAFCDAPWVPIFLAVCFLLHPWLGLVALVGAIFIFFLALANELLTRKYLSKAGSDNIAANNYVSSSLKNVEVIQAMGMKSHIHERWRDNHDQVLGWQAAASDRAGLVMAMSKFVRMFLQVAILGVGAYLAIHQEISPGTMIAASIIMGRALAPVEMAVGTWKGFVNARNGYRRIQGLFHALPDEAEKMPLPSPEGNLVVEAITNVVPGTRNPIIKQVSFALEAGETLAVIGPSASGKSSLARSLVGVWPVVAGAVRIDGADLKNWDREALGEFLGYLPQDVELFRGTVAENISRFGEIDHEEIVKTGTLAGVHDMIQKLPNGYDTEVGDGGQSLSGGQRQRLGLARALYKMPKLIVLDEPNASLDSNGEEALVAAIGRAKEAKSTVILITHKANLLSIADKILVMNDGAVQMFGPKEAVLEKLMGPKVVHTAQPAEPSLAAQK